MDANGTHFQMLLGEDDWGQCAEQDLGRLDDLWNQSSPAETRHRLYWDDQRKALTLKPELHRFHSAAKDVAPNLDDRRGAASDRYGNWYWIDQTRLKIRVLSAGSGTSSDFWPITHTPSAQVSRRGRFHAIEPPGPAKPLLFGGLTVTEDHYLVVGVVEPSGLLIFDLYAGGPPQQVCWPKGVEFAPFDFAAAPGGGVWILDREHRRYWALDRHLNVIRTDQDPLTIVPERPDDFQPIQGGPLRRTGGLTFPEGITLAASSPLEALDPIAIEALPDGTVLILDRTPEQNFSQVMRYRWGRRVGEPVSTAGMADLIDPQDRQGFELVGHDFAFFPEHSTSAGTVPDRLYVVAADGNQAFAFNLALQGDQLKMQPLPDYLPMRLFSGKSLVATDTEIYYDLDENWLPLVTQRRPRFAATAILLTPIQPPNTNGSGSQRGAWDGRDPDCVWHRLMLDASLPSGTGVQVWSRAANTEQELASTAWQAEPKFYLRGNGSELPFVRQTQTSTSGTWELLFQHARGQFLQLKLQLSGNSRATPRLRSLRAYYPRFSYLSHYLPAVYREDAQSASFLDRFLANVEGFFTATEDKIAAAQVLFDVRSAPPDALDWLAGWFAWVLDPAWDETRRRLLIRHAMDFFACRGTVRGLIMALRLSLDPSVDDSLFTDAPLYVSRRIEPRRYCGCQDPAPLLDRPSKLIHPSNIRIVEKFSTRQTPGIVLGDPTDQTGPRQITPQARWLPSQGAAQLHLLYQQALGLDSSAQFPLTSPGGSAAAAWQQFARTTLGFVPSATTANLQLWQDFLARRYEAISAVNLAYKTAWTSFVDVQLPAKLPDMPGPLLDWYQFEGVVLAMHRAAHQFTVLLPSQPTDAEHQRWFDVATRIVNFEKPAHTTFDVKFYWAAFRVGEARVGLETLLDRGSRAPQFHAPMILGQGHLAENFLAARPPQDATDRFILGRDPI